MKDERRFTKSTATRKGLTVYKDDNPLGVPRWRPMVIRWTDLTTDELQDIVYHAANACTVQTIRMDQEQDQELF